MMSFYIDVCGFFFASDGARRDFCRARFFARVSTAVTARPISMKIHMMVNNTILNRCLSFLNRYSRITSIGDEKTVFRTLCSRTKLARPPPPGLARRVARTAQCSSLRRPSARFPSRPGSSRRALCAVFSHFAGRLLAFPGSSRRALCAVFSHFAGRLLALPPGLARRVARSAQCSLTSLAVCSLSLPAWLVASRALRSVLSLSLPGLARRVAFFSHSGSPWARCSLSLPAWLVASRALRSVLSLRRPSARLDHQKSKKFFFVFYHFSRCLGYLTVYYVLFNGFFLNFLKTFSSLFNNFFFLFSFQHFMF